MRPLPLPAHDLAQAADPSDWWNVVDRSAAGDDEWVGVAVDGSIATIMGRIR